MVSSDVRNIPFGPGSAPALTDLASVLDRLSWHPWSRAALAMLRDPQPTPGRRSQPVADGPSGSMQWGWGREGQPVWIRTWSGGVPEGYDVVRAEAAHALAPFDAIVPAIVGAATPEAMLLDRMGWAAPAVTPVDDIVRRFVESSLLDALASGRCVITGEVHVLEDERLVIEDIGGIHRLETVDRAVLFGAIEALVAGSTTRLEALIAEVTGGLDDHRRWVAKRCVAGLLLEWSPVSFTLALRDIARTLLVSRSTYAFAFAVVTDEVAHRADLAHRHRCPLAFGSPAAVHHLLEQAA